VAGLVTGAAINLCADSLPSARRVRPPECAHCGTRRPLAAWSAVIAYLIRRHRCPSCAAPVPLRHVVVELCTMLLFVFNWWWTGATAQTLFNVLWSSAFVLIAVIDLEHRLIQHVVMLPALVLALVGAFINPAFDSPVRPLLGGAIGLLCTFGLYLLGGLFARYLGRVRGKPISEVAFGFGDVTLTTFIGLVVGAPEVVFALLIGIICGGIVALAYVLIKALVQRRYTAFMAIPYGPFLILGGAVMLYFGQEILAWYTAR
jgi:leader peptidase (prepilin peptidase)/N-methyltransferase